MHSFTRHRWVRSLWVVVGLVCVASAGAQGFDVQESPITAEELAEELGYRFHGSTWKFSTPTYVRVRIWSAEAKAADTPTQPPTDAQWTDVYTPDKPLTQVTIHALQKNDKKDTGGKNGDTRVQMTLKVNATGKNVPENKADGQLTTTSGSGNTITLGFTEGPREGFHDEWRYANGNLGIVFQSAVESVAQEAVRPGQPVGVDTRMRGKLEASMRAAPLNVCYFKGELTGPSDEGAKKRAVCLVTLECSPEPF